MGNKNVSALGGGALVTDAAPIMREDPASAISDAVIADRGNPKRRSKTGASATSESQSVLHWSVGIVVIALLLLWLFGGVVFKNALV